MFLLIHAQVSENQLSVWRYPLFEHVGDLIGHDARVLHCAVSPSGTTIVSASADETLRLKFFDL